MNQISNIQTIEECVAKGNLAIKNGNQEECLKWYYLGLKKATKFKNKIKENEISNLIFSLL